MRLGVLDIGSNTVHLLVVDAHPGARPLPAFSHKSELRLAQQLDEDGSISKDGAQQLEAFVGEAMAMAGDQGCEEILAFATSAIREAPNGEAILTTVRKSTGAELEVLPGSDEARLTFLAVRRWYGWSAGRLLVLDIGGGSLELASGIDEEPDAVASMPLGAGRLTRDFFTADPPKSSEVKKLRKHVRTTIARDLRPFSTVGAADHAVATSKTFRQLARITGAAPSSEGVYAERALRLDELTEWVPKLLEMPASKRAQLPGVSSTRAAQLAAGAIVAEAAMELLGVEEAAICPWALREGLILRRLDWMQGL
ncbi:MAG: Ppx/GppA phosphatase family protein [Actinomycetales bacterium]